MTSAWWTSRSIMAAAAISPPRACLIFRVGLGFARWHLDSTGAKKAFRVDRQGLRVVQGRPVTVGVPSDPVRFQDDCVQAYLASWVARGFSPVTIENDAGVLERVLALLGCPAWEVTVEDVDRVVGELAAQGLATATRRGYVQAFKGFHRFLLARKAAEIDAVFGVRLSCPVDEFNAARHVGDESPGLLAQ